MLQLLQTKLVFQVCLQNYSVRVFAQ